MTSRPRALSSIPCLLAWAAMSSYGAETLATANAVNDFGVIAGAKYTDSYLVVSRATMWWFRNQFVLDLGTLPGGTSSEALGVNNLGQVVGYSTTRDGSTHAFLWHLGMMRDLGTLGREYAFSRANGINDRGEIVGVSCQQPHPEVRIHEYFYPGGDSSCRAFLWKQGRMRDLGVYPGGNYSVAQAINNRGQVAGFGDLLASDEPYGYADEVRALLWSDGVPAAITGTRLCLCDTFGTGINDRGVLIGYHVSSGSNWAFSWINGRETVIGQLGGRLLQVTLATGINNRGQIVGLSPFSAPGFDDLEIAFLRDKGKTVALPTLRPQSMDDPQGSRAQAINEFGLIVGTANGKAVIWEHGVIKALR